MVVSFFKSVHCYLGKIPILTNIFQMGWNHQPAMVCPICSIFNRWLGTPLFSQRFLSPFWGRRINEKRNHSRASDFEFLGFDCFVWFWSPQKLSSNLKLDTQTKMEKTLKLIHSFSGSKGWFPKDLVVNNSLGAAIRRNKHFRGGSKYPYPIWLFQ